MSAWKAFGRFPRETAIIGQILAGYTDLESSLMNCVHVVHNDFDTVLKVMFRSRGESTRIKVGDAFGRHYHHQYGLGQDFETAISDLGQCKKN